MTKSKRVLRPRKGQYVLKSDESMKGKSVVKVKEFISYRGYDYVARSCTIPNINRTKPPEHEKIDKGMCFEFHPSGRIQMFFAEHTGKVSASSNTIIYQVFESIKKEGVEDSVMWETTIQPYLSTETKSYDEWKNTTLVNCLDTIFHFDPFKYNYMKKSQDNRCNFIVKIEKKI
jgi:hypothetical protein